MASILTDLIPQTPGLLPKWLLFTSVLSLGNTLQSFLTLSYTRRVYNIKPNDVSPLAGRLFGVWTALSGFIRLYGAYHLEDTHVYRAVFLTYILALGHFGTEAFVFGSASPTSGALAPFVVASTSLIWLWMTWAEYVVY